MRSEKLTIQDLHQMKQEGYRVALLTAYDFSTAMIEDDAGVEAILVGDSLGMVVLGDESTLQVTMELIVAHTRAVSKAVTKALVVADMPYMSFQVSIPEAIRNAGRLMAEGGADAVKLEGGQRMADTVAAIVRAGIPVMGHVGLTPQARSLLGGFKVQGRTLESARQLLEDATALEQAGVFAIIMECIPHQVAKLIHETVHIPTYGIGAGSDCDGQILVINDMLGLSAGFLPRFAKRYAELDEQISHAVKEYVHDVKSGEFPSQEHAFRMSNEELHKLQAWLSETR